MRKSGKSKHMDLARYDNELLVDLVPYAISIKQALFDFRKLFPPSSPPVTTATHARHSFPVCRVSQSGCPDTFHRSDPTAVGAQKTSPGSTRRLIRNRRS